MRELIIEILEEEDYNSFQSRELTASKITFLVFAFIEWLWFLDTPFIPYGESWTTASNPGMELFTLNEVFQYWQININNQ